MRFISQKLFLCSQQLARLKGRNEYQKFAFLCQDNNKLE